MIYKYNGCGYKCPIPLIEVRLLLKNMAASDQCFIVLNDSGSITDIPKYLEKKGYIFTKKILTNHAIQIKIKSGFTIGNKADSSK